MSKPNQNEDVSSRSEDSSKSKPSSLSNSNLQEEPLSVKGHKRRARRTLSNLWSGEKAKVSG